MRAHEQDRLVYKVYANLPSLYDTKFKKSLTKSLP